MPSEIDADERLLRHVFTTLLTKPIKYSNIGRTVQFEIGCSGEELFCAIRNRGIGIPEADREQLFTASIGGRMSLTVRGRALA
ncbi:MAG: sensor histidine kinase [Verrucomicrobia bacterium]|nr:sensor histidine kinase [Verrucomicrobiota bacterium]